MNNLASNIESGGDDIGIREEGEVNKSPPGDPSRLQSSGSISSLNEAWLHVLDKCVTKLPLTEVILPIMRDCFFAGATYAVLRQQKGHGDDVARDIVGFVNEAARPVPPEPTNLAERRSEPSK
jgi:hypothetical protein